MTTSGRFATLSETIDTGVIDSATLMLDIAQLKDVNFDVIGETGTHNNHRCVIDCTIDGTNWTLVPNSEVITEGMLPTPVKDLICLGVRVRVSQAESMASTSKINIFAK